MKTLKYLILLTFLFAFNHLNAQDSWNIDNDLKFQIGYFPTKELLDLSGKNIVDVQSANLSPSYLPDISNINLENFLKLGFQIPSPKNPSQYNFFLKLYEFPKIFNAGNITGPIISEYNLDKINRSDYLKTYLSDVSNLYVKLGYIDKSDTKFSKSNPYPPFKIINNKSFQQTFNEHLPFYSLYLTPATTVHLKTDKEKVENSTLGVKAFYKDLLEVYKKNFKAVKGNEDLYYFTASLEDNNKITVITLPKNVTVFDNWKELPMPQNPKKVFLTSLLLVNSTTYSLRDNYKKKNVVNLVVDSDDFNKCISDKVTKILEIGSVVKL